jgi:hypothetical protein
MMEGGGRKRVGQDEEDYGPLERIKVSSMENADLRKV